MIQRDYFLRMIEEATQVLATLMGLTGKGEFDQAQTLLEKSYNGYFKFSRDQLMYTEEPDLIKWLTEERELIDEQLSLLADFLWRDGQWHYAQSEREKGDRLLKKGIVILKYLQTKQTTLYSFERVNKIALMEEALKGSEGV
ncbi:MAG: hypothetical protein AAFR61_06100 [Bacteroidota bacterium]